MVAAIALAAPALAGANEYCVDVSPPECDGSFPGDIQGALNAASANPGDDKVLIGIGTYSTGVTQAQPTGFSYSAGSGRVEIIGSGQGNTALSVPTPVPINPAVFTQYTILQLINGSGSVENLTIAVPTPPTGSNYQLRAVMGVGATVRDVAVTGPGVPFNGPGFQLTNSSVEDTTMSLPIDLGSPATLGIQLFGTGTIRDSAVTADTAISHSGPGTLTAQRLDLEARLGLQQNGDGTIEAESSIVDLGSRPGAIGLEANNSNNASTAQTINADHMTIVGGAAGSIGATAVGDSVGIPTPPDPSNDTVNNGEIGTVTLSNSVISGPETALSVLADTGEVANLTATYSNYTAPVVEDDDISNSGATGNATLTTSNITSHPPMFVSATDFHLQPTSQLIDIGDPAGPALGAEDIDGENRAQDGLPGCPSASDLGADEVPGTPIIDCLPPETAIDSGPTGPTADSTPTFAFSSELNATFECRVDGAAFGACTGPGATHTATALGDGVHTFEVRATDSSPQLNVDPTPATRSFSVDTTPPDTTVSGKAKIKTKRKRVRASFTLGSTEPGSSFECSVDGAAFSSCTSPLSASLRRGTHTIRARAKDALGNQDVSPASFRVKVKKKKPKPR
jgi:hypothetical protein